MSAPEEMVAAARQAMERAYAPYSKFQVGAVVRGADGTLYGGCNVENAAYPQGWCAETSAIAAMVAAGERRIVVYRYGPSWGTFRHGYRPSSELLERLTPERRQIVQPLKLLPREPQKRVEGG